MKKRVWPLTAAGTALVAIPLVALGSTVYFVGRAALHAIFKPRGRHRLPM